MSVITSEPIANGRVSKNRVTRKATTRWVPIPLMKVSALGQRALRQHWADHLATNFDPDNIGYPVVNQRDGSFWIIDGQHRIAALKAVGWGDQQIQCEVFEGLSEREEAEEFLRRQERLGTTPIEKFRIAVQAQWPRECDIDRIVRLQGLRISTGSVNGITAVSALGKVYDDGGAATLGRTLRILRDAFGEGGMTGAAIHGTGLVCTRYAADLDDARAVERLSKVLGGLNGLMNRANLLRKQTGRTVPHCVAAATVDIYNSGRGGRKLADWWRTDD